MNIAVFWDIAPCSPYVNRRFGETYHLQLQDRKIRRARNQRTVFDPDDGNDTFLRNVGSDKYFTALYVRIW
jgi:hypothetical protein